VIPYAAINVKGLDKNMVANDNGEFTLTLPKGQQQITLSITAIGIRTTVVYKAPFNKAEKIYVDVAANALNEFAIKALSAEEVVKMAVAAIPANYADSSYFDHSFYRRYQKVNGHFVNLCEATPVVMFRLARGTHKIASEEAFAVNELRRSTFHPNIMNAREDNPEDLLELNPVYHLQESSLNPEKFLSYRFRFDTTGNPKDYVIRYVCNDFSTDHHGLADYEFMHLEGEEWETGELMVDRETFAIKKITRRSLRHKDYGYIVVPIPNNVIEYDYHKYFFEFVDGDLEAEYAQCAGKWYLKKMFRQYTNEFYTPVFNERAFVITDNFEWYSDSISRYTTSDFILKFYSIMATAIHSYRQTYWEQIDFPFHYYQKEDIYRDLEKEGPAETQYYNESKVDEYTKKKPKK